jgi:hypothetical protein
MRKIIRKFIVREFALGVFVKIFGIKIRMLRAPRIIFPTFISLMICEANYLPYYVVTFFLILFMLEAWIGFSWFGVGYFDIWPVKWDELDEYQKYYFGLEKWYMMTIQERNEWDDIVSKNPDWKN